MKNNFNEETTNDKKGINRKYLWFALCFIFLSVAILVVTLKKKETKYLIEHATLEYSEIVSCFIIKDEIVVDMKNEPKIAVTANGARVSKNGIIATYKSGDYEEYLRTLEKMDEEIHSLMQVLPAVYSSEIESIENQIRESIKLAYGITSKVNMQSCVTFVNSLINKRATVVTQLSVSASELNQLVKKRNQYVEQAKTSDEHILSPISGIVSYSVDNVESKLVISNIDNLTYENVKNHIQNMKISSGIKVTNNFTAYIMIQVQDSIKDNIIKGKDYVIRLLEANGEELVGKVYSIKEDNDTGSLQVVFKIMNKVESLVDLRETEIEIVWWKDEGLYAPLNAIDNVGDVSYVKAIKYGQYVQIPIIIEKQTNKYAIIRNYTEAELTEKNLTRQYSLKMYDRVVMEVQQ